MYRYSVDNAITYTSEDVVLFRESPFACWMERLTLENPDHGIPPDAGSTPPGNSMTRQDDLADTLRGEGKDVRLIDWDADEASRRSATLDAMRKGADFIVNGQLALGPLSGSANLLVRTSGYSELGDFLYTPCDTQAKTTLHSAFRLCFLADLLHSLQGQLPPQMLIIRGGDDLMPLQTENHIYHYLAVKQRFMEAMRSFRKHRMPDPVESSQFGRWSDCAHEVLKQRILQEEQREQGADAAPAEHFAEPLRKAVGARVGGGAAAYDMDEGDQPGDSVGRQPQVTLATPTPTSTPASPAHAGSTLAEQARMLAPGTYKPGPGVFRLRPVGPARAAQETPATAQPAASPVEPRGEDMPRLARFDREQPARPAPSDNAPEPAWPAADRRSDEPLSAACMPQHNRRVADAALQNLEFIGSSSQQAPQSGTDRYPDAELPPVASTAPAPSLRDPRTRFSSRTNIPPFMPAPEPSLGSVSMLHDEPSSRPAPQVEVTPPDYPRPLNTVQSGVDMDSTHPVSPPSFLATADVELPGEFGDDQGGVQLDELSAGPYPRSAGKPFSDSIFNDRIFTEGAPDDKFSNSLMTSEDYDD